MNKHNKTSSISHFNFATLYTKVPFNELINLLNELIDFCLRSRQKYISVNTSSARWTEYNTENSKTFTKSSH